MIKLDYSPALDLPLTLERFWRQVWFEVYPTKDMLLSVGPAYDTIKSKYKDPRRHYHNWSHPQKMLRMLTIMLPELKQTYGNLLKETDSQTMEVAPELIWAIGYHDVEYDVESQKNEENSANLMQIHLGRACTDLATQLVLVTKTHKPVGMSIYECIMCDLDLHFLGVPWKEYKENTKAIADEYCRIYTPEIWEMGRKNFCKEFSKRDRIFYTSPFFDRFEKQARENLQRGAE